MFILNANEPEELATHLKQQNGYKMEKLLFQCLSLRGNMNCVLRIETAARSFIIKQSRGYVEKYPQILPAERVLTEGAFYEKIARSKCSIMPVLIGIDAVNNLIALEDLGKQMIIPFCMI
jgi:5-methylthioribose kinase